MSVSSQAGFPVGDSDDLCEAGTDFTRAPSNLLEDDMWLAIAREMPYSKSN
jgi:hypothetical protein